MNNQNKNFQIVGFKQRVVMDPKYSEKTWRLLENAIRKIYNQNASCLSFEELYRNAYNMVLHNFGDKLYSGLVSAMTGHIKEMALSVEATQGGSFLEEMIRKWNDHNKALQIIGDILMYMDRTYILSSQKTPVHELGLNLWRENVIYSTQIRTTLLSTLSQLIHNERAGEVIDRGLMRNITKMLMDLGPSVYEHEFETPFLQSSVEFYKLESHTFIECGNCGDYMKQTERRLNEERDRAYYLDAGTEKKITHVVEKEMIEKYMHRLIHMENSGLVNMLCDDKYEDLGRMYNLFRRVPDGLSKVREVMTSHLRESGKQLVIDPARLNDPVEFVQILLDKKDKYDKIINLAFNNDKSFQIALNSSFEFFINLNPRLPEFISLFVDHKLRKSLKEASEDDVEGTLDKVMMLFRYLHEKDMFEKYYKQHLAKRLLCGKTVSDDAERSVIVKLKTECGCQYTSKLEGMFLDMKTSADTMQGFYGNHPELADGPTLTVQVLSSGFWPIQSSVACYVPAEIWVLSQKFGSYYFSIHTGRNLSWQTNMGTADLKATFGEGKKHELKNVSTYQMCVLMLFNNAERLSYQEIQQATEIPDSDLKRCLQSLSLVKGRNVLTKEPLCKDVGWNDAFFVNDEFSSNSYKVKIGTVAAPQMESESEKVETRQRVKEDRKPQIDAAIMRTMKARKQLDHNNLIAQVTMQLRFLPNLVEVKKRIESLIEQEFLERDKDDRNLYRYLV